MDALAIIKSLGQDKDNDERIDWKTYFMLNAYLISLRSPCKRLHVGCVIVKDNHIVSTGYNGYLPNTPHESIIRDGHEIATVHSEQNCMADCAKRGVSTDNAIAYVTHFPCINCFKILVASGIKRIIYSTDYNNDDAVYALSKLSNVEIVNIVDIK